MIPPVASIATSYPLRATHAVILRRASSRNPQSGCTQELIQVKVSRAATGQCAQLLSAGCFSMLERTSSLPDSQCTLANARPRVRAMLALVMALLLFAGGALVGLPIEHETGRASEHDMGQLSRTNAADLHYSVAIASTAAALSVLLGFDELGSAPRCLTSDDADPDDDCCGSSCHAAVGNGVSDGRSLDSFAPDAPVDLPGLDGKSQDPPDRPPRRA